MQFDNLLNLSTSQAVTVTAASSVFDVTGAGSGVAPNMIGGISSTGATLVIGDDIGAGDGFAIPEIFWNTPTAFTGTVNGSTLTIQLQAAPDNGSNSPGTYVTLLQTEPFSTTILTAGASGQFQIPPVPPQFWFSSSTLLPFELFRKRFVYDRSDHCKHRDQSFAGNQTAELPFKLYCLIFLRRFSYGSNDSVRIFKY